MFRIFTLPELVWSVQFEVLLVFFGKPCQHVVEDVETLLPGALAH